MSRYFAVPLRAIGPCVAAAGLLLLGRSAAAAESPDWGGWWITGVPPAEEFILAPPPFKPGLLEKLKAGRAADLDPDPLRYCRPLRFVGHSGGFVDALEFLFTPGRVTLATESGLLRRIYLDVAKVPADREDSNTGTSIGHWEGQTLVVETTHIRPDAPYPNTAQGSLPVGRGVRITERITLKDRNTLQMDVETSAPELFTRPDRRTRLYTRQAKPMADEISFCSDADRSIDPRTGSQRFDMTPPADLPPPPGR